jgi:TetR/AcrR family tetracycline transcriptional repressor
MSRRTAAGLTRERVVRAGLDLVDREGVNALTMRRLGRELGVEAMSLYGYVTSKQDLLDSVLELVYDEMPLTATAGGSWSERLRHTAGLVREVLLRHPNTVGLAAARPAATRGKVGLLDAAELELQRAGLGAVQAAKVVTVVVSFTIGHVANEVGGAERHPRDAEFDLGLDFIISGVERLVDDPMLAAN